MWLCIDTIYDVSIDGQIRKKMRNGHTRIMKGALDTKGRRQICMNGKLHSIHRTVASRWLPAPTQEGLEIDHIDRNILNNHASNLRWCNHSDNMLNRTFKIPTTKERYITEYKLRSGNIRYVFAIKRGNKYLYQKYHLTLEEAILDRNNYLETIV